MFLNIESLYIYKSEFSTVLNNNRIYFEQTLINKAAFLDSYLGEICHITNDKTDEYLQMMGFSLSNEIDTLVEEVETEIQNFFNSNKKKKSRVKYNQSYDYEYQKHKQTDLYNFFVKEEAPEDFGDFSLCFSCKFYGNCPLKFYTNSSALEDSQKPHTRV